MRTTQLRNVLLAIVWWLAACWWQWAAACQVPVFRYALERWEPAPWKVVVYHRGPLSVEQQRLVDRLNVPPDDPQHVANVEAAAIDLSQNPPTEAEDIYERSSPTSLPWLVLIGPHAGANAVPLWAAALDETSVRQLTESPLRRELARRLLSGDAVVWVLLESGDKGKDNAVEATLTRQLKTLEKQLTLSDAPSDAPPADADAEWFSAAQPSPGVPLRVAFSVLRVSRNAPREQVFVRTLLAHESGLEQETGPIAFPIFGRGRVLAALCGSDISRDAIVGASEFLVSDCSCTVKGERLGTDLLIAADWAGQLESRFAVDQALPSLSGVMPTAIAEPATNAPSVRSTPRVFAANGAGGVWRSAAIAVGAIVAIVLAGTVVVWRRGREQL